MQYCAYPDLKLLHDYNFASSLGTMIGLNKYIVYIYIFFLFIFLFLLSLAWKLFYFLLIMLVSVLFVLPAASFLTAALCWIICVDLEQEFTEALATWVLDQNYSLFFACMS